MLTPMAAVVSGEYSNPIRSDSSRALIPIYDVYDLQNMSNNISASYYLANDIDASDTKNWNGGAGFDPVGNSSGAYTIMPMMNTVYPNSFKGNFDGKGHRITGLYIYRPSQDCVGLFGRFNYSAVPVITNVSMFDVDVTGHEYVGGLVGITMMLFEISKVYLFKINITGTADHVGGIAGYLGNYYYPGNLNDSGTTGKVSGAVYVGGLAGRNDGITSRCFSYANVSGTYALGGLLGYLQTSVYDSHANGAVSGTNAAYSGIGGFVGSDFNAKVINCYSTGKVTGTGLVGGFTGSSWYGTGTHTNCFWDTQTSGWVTSAFGTGKTTSEMKKQATFTGYDFSGVWGISENQSYPYIRNCNIPPRVLGTDVLAMNEDASYRSHYEVELSPYPNITNIYNLSFNTNATAWLSFNSTSGNLSGTPDNTDIGSYWVNFTVNDTFGLYSSRNFTITVNNIPPVFTNVPPSNKISVNQDLNVTFDFGCDDEGLGMTRYGFDTAPAWLSINSSTGVISGKPGNADVGLHTVVLFANDGWGGRTNYTVDITVVDVNDPPHITTPDVLTATQGVPYSVVYQLTDIDAMAQTFTWSLATNASWLGMNGTTGHLSGLPGNSDVGSWYVNVSVSDGRGGSDSRNFTGTVANVNDPPVIVTSPAMNATEGVEYLVDFNATDIDVGDTLFWTLDTIADWLSINSTTGVLSGTSAEKDVGSVWVSVTVADASSAKANVGYTLRVLNVNDWPVWVSVPSDVNLTEGSVLFLDVQATDTDAMDSIRYSISSVPACGISVNPASGAIRWLNVSVGNYTVTITATDGLLNISVAFNITVNAIPVAPPPPVPPANKVPTMDAIGDRQATEGKALSVQITGTDADSYDARNLTFRLVSPPTGVVLSADGLLFWVPSKDQVGKHVITVSLTDGKNSTTASFNVTVAKATVTGGKTTDGGISTGMMAGIAIAMLMVGLAIGAVILYSTRSKPEKTEGSGDSDDGDDAEDSEDEDESDDDDKDQDPKSSESEDDEEASEKEDESKSSEDEEDVDDSEKEDDKKSSEKEEE